MGGSQKEEGNTATTRETLQLQTLRHMAKAPSTQKRTGVFAKDLNVARGVSRRANRWPVLPESGLSVSSPRNRKKQFTKQK